MREVRSCFVLSCLLVGVAATACQSSAGGGGDGKGGQAGEAEAAEGGAGGEPLAGEGGRGGSQTPPSAGGMAGTSTGGQAGGAQPSQGGQSGTGGVAGSKLLLPSDVHAASATNMVKLAPAPGCLKQPWDLAFNPLRPKELWAVNYGDDSVCLIIDATATPLASERRQEYLHEHFMPRPSALAFGGEVTSFGKPGTFATANDSAGDGSPNDGGMWNGITLWPSDLGTFGKYKAGPEGNSHLDMLHDSLLARGIAWEKNNIYWVFGSMFGDITRYDFATDHGRGFTDHSDGSQWHYAAGKVKGQDGSPSHLAYDLADGALYIADTGNHRIAKLDTKSGTASPTRHTRTKDRTETKIDAVMMDAKLTDVVAAGGDLKAPAGLELHADTLYVSDNQTGIIYAFSKTGQKLGSFDTGLGAGTVMGLAVGPGPALYFVAAKSDAIYMIASP